MDVKSTKMKDGHFKFRLSSTLKHKCEQIAFKKDVSLAYVVRQAMSEYVERIPQGEIEWKNSAK